VITSFYKHPAEMIVNSIIGSLLCYTLLGLDLRGGAVFTFCCAAGEFFYHTNVRTQRWVGWFFQRREMHRIHHEYARHQNNYGDITWWDMLFGTYENPDRFESTYSTMFIADRRGSSVSRVVGARGVTLFSHS
jgi:sterol desaturase/sphingolipid hydroxylase (fatty acid hydroxylase superfamily)